MILKEGGNVFKNKEGQSLTQRINQTDIPVTVDWLERLTDLDLKGKIDPKTNYPERWLGSTGKKPTSGDLDLQVSSQEISPAQLIAELTQWCTSQDLKPQEYVKKGSDQVHFRTPIAGNPKNGYVQTDFMFMDDLEMGQFFITAPTNSEYTAIDRHIMLNSIAKPLGYKIVGRRGLVSRADDQLVSRDPDEIAKIILNKNVDRDALYSVETMLQALQGDPKREEKLKDAKDYFAKNGIAFNESRGESDVNFLARLRDRIVNQGMQKLVEDEEPQVQGGKAKGIEHIEDLVFRRGSAGINDALAVIDHLKDNTKTSVSVKWDGSPAVIFGRQPDGTFVLTDTAGFTAVGYNGLFSSPGQIKSHLAKRDAEAAAKGNVANRVDNLFPVYKQLWPMLEAATPENFKGYIQGDLLYTSTPPEKSGAYIFKPNTIEYAIPSASPLGEQIGNSEVGIAIHTQYAEPGAAKQALGKVKLNPVPGLLLIEPIRPTANVQPAGAESRSGSPKVKQLKSLVSAHGKDINTLFNPAELRAQQITDLPKLCVDYINSLVKDDSITEFNTNQLLPGFVNFLKNKVTPKKYNNIMEYLQSPSSNSDGISAAFTAFVLLHDIKTDLLRQLDQQHPGQEGWVVAIPGGTVKFVNRFDFSRANQHRNR